MIEISYPVLDGWDKTSIDADDHADERGAQTSDSGNEPFTGSRPVSGYWLSTVRSCQAKSLVTAEADMRPSTQINASIWRVPWLPFPQAP